MLVFLITLNNIKTQKNYWGDNMALSFDSIAQQVSTLDNELKGVANDLQDIGVLTETNIENIKEPVLEVNKEYDNAKNVIVDNYNKIKEAKDEKEVKEAVKKVEKTVKKTLGKIKENVKKIKNKFARAKMKKRKKRVNFEYLKKPLSEKEIRELK